MVVRVLTSAVALLATVSVSFADGSPSESVAAGDRWTYRVERDDATPSLEGHEILGKNRDGDYLLGTFHPGESSDKYITDILLVLRPDDCIWDPFLRLVLRAGADCTREPHEGEVWKLDWTRGAGRFHVVNTWLGYEDIVVGAGTFHAMKFGTRIEIIDPDKSLRATVESTNWYSGQAKVLVRIDSRATMSGGGGQTLRAALESAPAR